MFSLEGTTIEEKIPLKQGLKHTIQAGINGAATN